MYQKFLVGVAGAAGVLAVAGSANAAVITAISSANTPTVENSIPTSSPSTVNAIPVGGTGNLGYYLYGVLPADVATGYVDVSKPQTAGNETQAGINGLPTWATVSFSNAGNSYMHTTDSQLAVNGTTYTTVENFDPVTITLGSSAPATFTLALLTNNSSDGTFNMTVASPASSPTSSATITDEYQPDNLNDFYYFNVTDALPGDTIQISFGGGGIGGFAFSSPVSPTPEPASLGLLAIASLGLLGRRRRAWRNKVKERRLD